MRAAGIVACLGFGLFVGRPDAVAADNAATAPCAFAAGRDISNNAVTCNFGLTPEQLKEATEAAVKGATGPLLDRIEAISKTIGVTQDAAKKLLQIVGEDPNVPADRLSEALSKVAADYKQLQAQAAAAAALARDNPIAQAFVTQANAEIALGHFGHAHELLHQATQAQLAAAQAARQLREQAQVAEYAQMLGAANATAVEAGVALTERHYTQAAALFGQAARYIPPGHPEEHVGYLSRQADTLFRQGDEFGDNAALAASIAIWKQLADQGYPRERVPLEWASTQNKLGIALWTLGWRESGTARLEEAVAVFRAALEEVTRERVPLLWAWTQSNLGIALRELGERESGTARLEAAVAAYRTALKEWTRERVPFQWAATQMNLGLALAGLGARESGSARLEEAVAAYREALEVETRERVPVQWALTQTNLGNALVRLGERESRPAHLEEAVVAYRASLEEGTRERMPLLWAWTQTNLGIALTELGEQESGTARLEEAVAAYRAALEEGTRARLPLRWAWTQNNLGNALIRLGERESGTAHLEEAVAAYRAAMEEWTRDRAPLDWAQAQMNLGIALEALGEREIGTKHLEEAMAAFGDSLLITQSVWPIESLNKVRFIQNETRAEIEKRQGH
jgi:tetratricopeptide (TPR) repeat protein